MVRITPTGKSAMVMFATCKLVSPLCMSRFGSVVPWLVRKNSLIIAVAAIATVINGERTRAMPITKSASSVFFINLALTSNVALQPRRGSRAVVLEAPVRSLVLSSFPMILSNCEGITVRDVEFPQHGQYSTGRGADTMVIGISRLKASDSASISSIQFSGGAPSS